MPRAADVQGSTNPAGGEMPGAAIECVEMNWANFIGGGFLLGCGRSSASMRPRHLCFLHIASLPQPTALTLSRYAWVLVDVFLFFNIQPYTNLTLLLFLIQ